MIIATFTDGREVILDPVQGATVRELLDRLTQESLTGSAVPFDDQMLRTATGQFVRYGDVTLEDVAS